MAQYANLIATINNAIKTNGVGAITGQLLQTILDGMVNSLGLNYQYAGIATPSTNPGSPDQRVLYLATQAGTYEHFGGAVLDGVTVHIFTYDGTWHDATLSVATKAELAAYLQIADLASDTGQSATTTMTQKAITDALLGLAEDIAQSMQEHVAKLPELVAGSSAGVLGRTVDAAFLFRRTAGTAKIGRGAAALMAILGNTEVSDGHLISNDAASVKTVGFNQWDGTYGEGYISGSGGAIAGDATIGYHSDYIPVLPETSYYNTVENVNRTAFYDANKKHISSAYYSAGSIITAPANCHYVRFDWGTAVDRTTICFNLSDPAKNGTYEPYWSKYLPLGLSTLTGKLNGQGASVVVFPDGLKSAGTGANMVQDKTDGMTADKLVGTRAYQSGDENDSTLTTDGTNTNYPLATPGTYVLDEPLQMSYQVENGGTEQAIAPEGATLPSAPFIAQIQYPLDVIALQGDSLADMLDAMVAAGVITAYTMTYNVAAQKYEFTINGVSRNLPENNRKGGGDDEPNSDDPGEEPTEPGGDIQEWHEEEAIQK